MENILSETVYRQTEQRIQSVSDRSKRLWGKMTVEQMLSHCADQIRLALGQKSPHEKPTFFNRNIVKYFGLWLPRIPIKNMKGPVDMNWQQFGSKPGTVDQEIQNLVSLLEQFRDLAPGSNLQPHPMFGKLNRNQWARFMYVHIDHHLRQFGA